MSKSPVRWSSTWATGPAYEEMLVSDEENNNDHEDEDEEGQVFFMQPSDEMREEMRRQHDLAVARGEDLRARIDTFLDAQTAESLYTFMQIIKFATGTGEGAALLHYLDGQAATLLRIVHKACAKCGDKHETSMHGIEKLAE